MRRVLLIGLVVTVLSGCSWFRDPPEQGITTGATVVYSGQGFRVFSICDKGNLIYSSEKNPQVAVVQGGCNAGGAPGLGGPGGVQSPVAFAAATPRTPDGGQGGGNNVTIPQPLVVSLPQPLLVQLVRPAEPPQVTTLPTEPRDVIIVTPPTAPPWSPPPGWVPPGWTPPPAVPQTYPPAVPQTYPAPSPAPAQAPVPRRAIQALVVSQLDPNTASGEDLERLPGVTAKMVQAIQRGRPYSTLQSLVEKKALSEAELKALAPYLVIR